MLLPIIALTTTALFLLSLAWVFATAPIGYEDETGFNYGEQPDDPYLREMVRRACAAEREGERTSHASGVSRG